MRSTIATCPDPVYDPTTTANTATTDAKLEAYHWLWPARLRRQAAKCTVRNLSL